mmetsp:Transcript_23747/g.42154  ORF Transcript_23747/g.42154 Transcript_23747/m.42154 type:complete len:87 (+) Transcript_23747:290-550(+)
MTALQLMTAIGEYQSTTLFLQLLGSVFEETKLLYHCLAGTYGVANATRYKQHKASVGRYFESSLCTLIQFLSLESVHLHTQLVDSI